MDIDNSYYKRKIEEARKEMDDTFDSLDNSLHGLRREIRRILFAPEDNPYAGKVKDYEQMWIAGAYEDVLEALKVAAERADSVWSTLAQCRRWKPKEEKEEEE